METQGLVCMINRADQAGTLLKTWFACLRCSLLIYRHDRVMFDDWRVPGIS